MKTRNVFLTSKVLSLIMEKLSLLEKLSIKSSDFPVYVGGYERCVVSYAVKAKRNNAPEVIFDLLPEDAVFPRNVYLKKRRADAAQRASSRKDKKVGELGALEHIAGEVKIANRECSRQNYTFIPREH